jgi:predicted dehydrogenase
MTIHLAISGAGFIAEIHVRAIRANREASLVAVVEHFSDKAQAFARKFNIPRIYRNLEELIRAGGVDALVIGVPNLLHAPQTMAALKAGLGVLVEKPMALNAREALKMMEASQKYQCPLMVGHCWRFHEDVLWLKQKLQQKPIGRIIRTKGYGVHTRWGPSGWFTKKAMAGGGALVDMGIHALDTARFLIGDPKPDSVYARIGTHYIKGDVDDTGVLIVNWANSVTSYIEAGWWQPHSDGSEAATQLYGSEGFGSVFPTRLEQTRSQSRRTKVYRPMPGIRFSSISLMAMYKAQMAAFLKALSTGRQPEPGGLEGLTNMLVLDAAYTSARTGNVIKVRS